ncbi:hypothetical protein LINGRAHAP2_LOCUS4366 [Linum grandiflorum]
MGDYSRVLDALARSMSRQHSLLKDLVVETEIVLNLVTDIQDQTTKQKPSQTTPRRRAPPKARTLITPATISKRKKPAKGPSPVVVIDSDIESAQSETKFPEKVIKLKSPVSPILDLEADELAVIYYIFSEGFPEEEVLFDMRQHMLRRSDLYTLLPKKWLNSEVITAASYRAANYSLAKNGRVIWFLPAMLSTHLMTGITTYQQAVDIYRHTPLLRNSTNCEKIYIPMKDDNHWYVAVILMDVHKIHMLDSLPLRTKTTPLKKAIEKAAKFLYLMLNAMVPTDHPVVEVPRIIDFDIVSPENVPKQGNSYDCGL